MQKVFLRRINILSAAFLSKIFAIKIFFPLFRFLPSSAYILGNPTLEAPGAGRVSTIARWPVWSSDDRRSHQSHSQPRASGSWLLLKALGAGSLESSPQWTMGRGLVWIHPCGFFVFPDGGVCGPFPKAGLRMGQGDF